MNIYTLEMHKRFNKPLVVVTIKHVRLHGVYFFKDMESARRFIRRMQVELPGLVYDGSAEIPETAAVLRAVLNDPNIIIGENGRTYDKRFFKGVEA